MELRHLRAFRVVARTLNLTRAAAELHYAQSSVTEQIQHLEADLGTRLFDRTGRGLVLTAAGDRLVEYADQVLALVEEARTVVHDEDGAPSGELVVGALETLCAQRLPAMLADYRARWPRVRAVVREGNRGELYRAVRQGDVDVCLTFGTVDDPQLATRTLAHEPLVVVTPPGHRLAGRVAVTMDDLAGEAFLVTEQGCGFREMYDRAAAGRPHPPVVVAEVASLAALGRCVANGMGCGLLPAMAVPDGAVATVPLGAEASTPVTMTWQRRREGRPAVAAFLAGVRVDG